MPRLQFPFTAGLTPTSVQAIQQLIQQNERRQAQKAAAKAETERLKAQSTRRIGDAIGSGVTNILSAVALQKGTENQRQHQLDLMQNRTDLQNFGLPTDQIDTMADNAFGQLERIGPFSGELGPQLPSQEQFRAGFRQQIASTQAQQAQQVKQQQAQQQQLQKAATQQRIQAWFPGSELEYDPGTTQKMALLRQQVQESITNPDMSLPPEQRQIETRDLERQLGELRKMGMPKPKFDKTEFTKRYIDIIPPGANGEPGAYVVWPPDGKGDPKLIQIRTSQKGDENLFTGPKAQVKALEEAESFFADEDDVPPDMIFNRMLATLDKGKAASSLIQGREELRQRGANERRAIQQRSAGRARQLTQAATAASANRLVPPPPGSDLSKPLFPGPSPRQRPSPPRQQPAGPQQQAVHPAIAKIKQENINPKAVEIIQKAGGTSDPISIEDLKRSGMNRSEIKKSLRVGQIYIAGGNAAVWDGKNMIPLEKPT